MKLYARREPSTDSALKDAAVYNGKPPLRCADVVIYSDKKATKPVSRHPWHYSTKPTRRNKTVMHNCARYALEWLPDHPLLTQGYYYIDSYWQGKGISAFTTREVNQECPDCKGAVCEREFDSNVAACSNCGHAFPTKAGLERHPVLKV